MASKTLTPSGKPNKRTAKSSAGLYGNVGRMSNSDAVRPIKLMPNMSKKKGK